MVFALFEYNHIFLRYFLKVPSLARSVLKPLRVGSVPKPLKVPSLARSVPKPLKASNLARSVPKPRMGQAWGLQTCH